MRSSERERQGIVDYVAMQTSDEAVELLEKVYSERVVGQKHDIWNVHTNAGRYWVITNPTNLYSQEQFPHMDIALTFHIGLMLRVLEHSPDRPSPERVARFAEPLRRLEQAAEALNKADEADEFQAVGMRCRESLLAFIKEAADVTGKPEGEEPPKAGDYVGWSNVIAERIASGSSSERWRGYLKSTAKATWELVNWLTHATNATRFDANFAIEATGWIISTFAIALVRFEHGHPDRCPRCTSYKLSTIYQPSFNDPKDEQLHSVICDVCGWESEPTLVKYGEKPRDRSIRRKKPRGECITVEVPLRGPAPPKPSQ
jgi:hypothetical protein